MKSGSMPSECSGEPDDKPRRYFTPKCDVCGRFVDCKPGSSAEFDFTPDSYFGPERAKWTCAACVRLRFTRLTPRPGGV